MENVQGQSTNGISTVGQAAAVAALDGPQELLGERAASYRARRDLVVSLLNDAPGLSCHKPEGAFYLFPKAPVGTASEFVARAIENNVLIIPGNVFSERDTHFRISYATTDEKLRAGVGL